MRRPLSEVCATVMYATWLMCTTQVTCHKCGELGHYANRLNGVEEIDVKELVLTVLQVPKPCSWVQ